MASAAVLAATPTSDAALSVRAAATRRRAASRESDDEDLEDALVIGAAAAVALAIAIGAVVLALRLRRQRPRRERGRGGRKLRPRSSVRRPRRGQYERARTVEV